MKKLFVLFFAAISISLSVVAQDSTATRKGDIKSMKAAYKGGKQHHKDNIKELNLTAEQKKEIKESRAEYKSKVTALEKDQNMTEAEKNEKKASLKKEQRSATQSLLTPDQKTKMAEQKMKDKQEVKDNAQKRMADMQTELSLSDDQVTRLKALEVTNHAKMKAIKKDKTMDETTKKQQMDALKTNAEAQRRNILSADQLKKMDEAKMKRGVRKS